MGVFLRLHEAYEGMTDYHQDVGGHAAEGQKQILISNMCKNSSQVHQNEFLPSWLIYTVKYIV